MSVTHESDTIHCPRCGSHDAECNGLKSPAHRHVCHACGYDGTAQPMTPEGLLAMTAAAIVRVHGSFAPGAVYEAPIFQVDGAPQPYRVRIEALYGSPRDAVAGSGDTP